MPRGGYHSHAERWGRKSAWNNASVTKTIRVPEALADRVLDIAHKLDADEVIDYDTKSNEQVTALKAEIEQLRHERDQLDKEVDELHTKVGDLDLELANLKEQQLQQQELATPTGEKQNLEALRDRYLASLKLGRQAPKYKHSKAAIDWLIEQL